MPSSQSRIDPYAASPDLYPAMLALKTHVQRSGLEPRLLHLTDLRVSQINGCAFCIDLHVREARQLGEAEARLHLLAAWRETTLYTPRERAALAWAEAVTLIADAPVAEAVYAEASRHFTDRELADLTLSVVKINGWNRLSVAFGRQPNGAP